MKIAIYCDRLVSKGGAQRHIIQLANSLNADIITSGYNPDLNNWLPIKVNVIDIGNILLFVVNPLGYLFESPIRFLLNRNRFNYDINIYCGFSSIFCSSKENKSKNIYYCLSPNRILYDLRETIIKNAKWYSKPFFILYNLLFYKYDQKTILNNFKKIIAQSNVIRNRVMKYYNKDCKIIYPPIDINKFKFKKFGDFYLTVSRLFPIKRISLIARAFAKLPQKKLIIVGDGPEKNKILNIIKNKKNIQLLVNVSEEKLVNLYSNCLAVIYMPIDEDFGLVPLEGMASGKICIAADEGACRETVVDRKTGFLIKATEKNIVNIINEFDVKQAKKMKSACINQAKRFSIEKYIREWKKEIKTRV
jgi:glycosyltransferase involved in cell wall biosynthesis